MAQREREPKPLIYDPPSGYSKQQIDAELIAIRQMSAELQELERAVIAKREAINARWDAMPAGVKIREEIPCRQCGKLTLHRFGGTAMCETHKGASNPILESLIYGNDDGR